MADSKRQLYIAGNWKMHKTTGEAAELASGIVAAFTETPHKIMVAPPFTALISAAEVLESSNVRLGAQNMASEESGAHTGEVAPSMLKDVGVQTVILGHSERRAIYGENDELINRKVKLALKHGFEVILCVGETIEQRESGKAEQVVESQLKNGLSDVSTLDNVIIAYEPVWAIGTGKTATPEDANAMHEFVRNRIADWYNDAVSDQLIIQYGGSVKPANAADLLSQPDIDGALVGGASLEVDSFAAIAKSQP